jgi:hypothetical protein
MVKKWQVVIGKRRKERGGKRDEDIPDFVRINKIAKLKLVGQGARRGYQVPRKLGSLIYQSCSR